MVLLGKGSRRVNQERTEELADSHTDEKEREELKFPIEMGEFTGVKREDTEQAEEGNLRKQHGGTFPCWHRCP
ncbi:hypothetical protein BV898_18621 [Hypsibius exemplaris]|uniref:Uncharacterized protein n=1 Tax=Hypsibius exemplaris TaxID=2072580 RepID=A0A9X6NHA2_HYPEX|nr:hypothetical protein BV898_18621 [Hypsibius exemplaris]